MSNKYIKTHQEFINANYFINETLSKSYSIDIIIKYLEGLGLDSDDLYENDGTIKLEVKLKHKDKYRQIIDKMENMFGWFLSGMTEDMDVYNDVAEIKRSIEYNLEQMAEDDFEEDDELFTLIFEPKYTLPISTENLPDIIYHITDMKFLDKIKKVGLVPKHKDKITYHPDRIYFLLDIEKVDELIDHPAFLVDNPVLLSIDISNFKKTNEFYIDPNLSDGGVYILRNIAPYMIVDYKEI